MDRVRVFVSSVQQELENERVAIAELINSDPFLIRHCDRQTGDTTTLEDFSVLAKLR